MNANLELQRVKEWQQLRGFANLFRKENQDWWGTRRWWINAMIWVSGLGGLVAMMSFMLPPLAEANGDPNVAAAGGPLAFGLQMGCTVFFELGTMALAIGVIVLSQDLIIAEKQSGVIDWLLAKPIARRSYVLAKLAASTLAVLILLVALPAIAVYLLLSIRAGTLFALLPFMIGVGIMAIHTLFYLTLTLMLGTILQSRAPVLGISLALLLGGNLLAGISPPLLYVTPWILGKGASLVASVEPVAAGMLTASLIATCLWSLVFTLFALAKFESTEF